jgi:hypothetical protein
LAQQWTEWSQNSAPQRYSHRYEGQMCRQGTGLLCTRWRQRHAFE